MQKKGGKYKKIKKFALEATMLAVGLGVLGMSALLIWAGTVKLPDFKTFENRKIIGSTKIYDRTGEVVLYDLHQDVKRTMIPFEEMGDKIKIATIAIEDSSFYQHKGIRPTSIVRAVLTDIIQGELSQGGSTITQQIVKNILLTKEKTITRKLKEWVLAIKIEKEMTKDEILSVYLNENPYGGNLYGIYEASHAFFAKEPADLTWAEASYLAAIANAPTYYSPYRKNKDKLDERKDLVLFRMKETGVISDAEYAAAKQEQVVFQAQQNTGIKAPHFVFFIKDYLEQKYGQEKVDTLGLKVTTTLDYDLQQSAEKITKDQALLNEKNFDGSNAALVAIDPKTGHILSMVGSRDYFDKNIDGNFNVTTAYRQPGSSFKPFIYATAFNRGYTPNTALFDVPTEFSTSCSVNGTPLPGNKSSDCYSPKNADGKFRGPISIRDALAQSINIPAVKTLYLVGIENSIKTAQMMGITSLDGGAERYGLTLVIGGGEVSLLDMTSAYGVFANEGVRNPYTGILKVEDVNGTVLEEYAPEPQNALPKNTALLISDILSDNNARIPTFGANSALHLPGHQVAAKTGTTNNNKDAWTVGYTPTIAVGVWVGNNDNKAMKKGGAALAGPIWNAFMSEALKKYPEEPFERPEPVVANKAVLNGIWQGGDGFWIDKISGKLATQYTPEETKVQGAVTSVHDILYWVNKNDPTGPAPANPANDPQFNHWEIPVQNWWAANSGKYAVLTAKPTEYDDIHTPALAPRLSILQPAQDTTYPKHDPIALSFTNTGAFPLSKIDIFINDAYIVSLSAPFKYTFTPDQIESIQENNTLKVIARDTVFNSAEASVSFSVSE